MRLHSLPRPARWAGTAVHVRLVAVGDSVAAGRRLATPSVHTPLAQSAGAAQAPASGRCSFPAVYIGLVAVAHFVDTGGSRRVARCGRSGWRVGRRSAGAAVGAGAATAAAVHVGLVTICTSAQAGAAAAPVGAHTRAVFCADMTVAARWTRPPQSTSVSSPLRTWSSQAGAWHSVGADTRAAIVSDPAL